MFQFIFLMDSYIYYFKINFYFYNLKNVQANPNKRVKVEAVHEAREVFEIPR